MKQKKIGKEMIVLVEYHENQVVLSGAAAATFQQKMNRPDANVAQKRDRNLNWIDEHMDFQVTATGFTVSVSE